MKVTVTVEVVEGTGAVVWWFEGELPRESAGFFDVARLGADGLGATNDRVRAMAAFDWLAEQGVEVEGREVLEC